MLLDRVVFTLLPSIIDFLSACASLIASMRSFCLVKSVLKMGNPGIMPKTSRAGTNPFSLTVSIIVLNAT